MSMMSQIDAVLHEQGVHDEYVELSAEVATLSVLQGVDGESDVLNWKMRVLDQMLEDAAAIVRGDAEVAAS